MTAVHLSASSQILSLPWTKYEVLSGTSESLMLKRHSSSGRKMDFCNGERLQSWPSYTLFCGLTDTVAPTEKDCVYSRSSEILSRQVNLCYFHASSWVCKSQAKIRCARLRQTPNSVIWRKVWEEMKLRREETGRCRTDNPEVQYSLLNHHISSRNGSSSCCTF